MPKKTFCRLDNRLPKASQLYPKTEQITFRRYGSTEPKMILEEVFQCRDQSKDSATRVYFVFECVTGPKKNKLLNVTAGKIGTSIVVLSRFRTPLFGGLD